MRFAILQKRKKEKKVPHEALEMQNLQDQWDWKKRKFSSYFTLSVAEKLIGVSMAAGSGQGKNAPPRSG
jgi:hypothetical protein